MGVKLAAALGGSVELVPTNTASNYTLTLPAATGTVLTNKSAGTVLQVVQGTFNSTGASISSTSYVSMTLTATITPSSSTSKILVLVQQNLWTNGPAAYMTIYRNGATNIGPASGFAEVGLNSVWATYPAMFLDSPATTSATTYTTYGKSGSGSMFISGDGTTNTITLLEIAA